MASAKVNSSCGVWSPCGRFIAAYMYAREIINVGVRDGNTLEIISTLELPAVDSIRWHGSLAFSLDGRLLACCYFV